MHIQLVEKRHVIVGGAKEKRIVHMTRLRRPLELIVKGFYRCGLRRRVGHLEIRGHATSSGCTALTLYIGLLRHSWLTEVHMRVDDTRQNVTSRGIYRLVDRCLGMLSRFQYFGYLLTIDDNRTLEARSFVDNTSSFN